TDKPEVRQKITEAIKLLCTHGADVEARVNAPDSSGRRPIHYCAETINSEAVAYLLQRGAQINKPDAEGRTALYLTTKDSHPDVGFVEMLIDKGARLGTV